MSGFRGDPIKENRIKKALFIILNDDSEVNISLPSVLSYRACKALLFLMLSG